MMHLVHLIENIPQFMVQQNYLISKWPGSISKKEIEYLSMIKDNPPKPFTLVIGGVKITDKIGALENLLPKADNLLVGGATAYTFLKAKGFNTGNSPIDKEHLS